MATFLSDDLTQFRLGQFRQFVSGLNQPSASAPDTGQPMSVPAQVTDAGAGAGPVQTSLPAPAPAEPPPPAASAPASSPQPQQQGFSPFDDTFRKYAGALANNLDFIKIVAAGTLAESGWNPGNTTGDGGHSWGLFQMHDAGDGAGMGAARLDPDTAASVMVPKYVEGFQKFSGLLQGAPLAAAVAQYAERSADPTGSSYASAYNQLSGGAVLPPSTSLAAPLPGEPQSTPQLSAAAVSSPQGQQATSNPLDQFRSWAGGLGNNAQQAAGSKLDDFRNWAQGLEQPAQQAAGAVGSAVTDFAQNGPIGAANTAMQNAGSAVAPALSAIGTARDQILPDPMVVMNEMTTKYGGNPDPSAMTPEDQQRYSNAIIAIAGSAGGGDVNFGGIADKLPAAAQYIEQAGKLSPLPAPDPAQQSLVSGLVNMARERGVPEDQIQQLITQSGYSEIPNAAGTLIRKLTPEEAAATNFESKVIPPGGTEPLLPEPGEGPAGPGGRALPGGTMPGQLPLLTDQAYQPRMPEGGGVAGTPPTVDPAWQQWQQRMEAARNQQGVNQTNQAVQQAGLIGDRVPAQPGTIVPRVATMLGGAGMGGFVGNETTPDTASPEERMGRIGAGAMIGAGAGIAGNALLKRPGPEIPIPGMEGVKPPGETITPQGITGYALAAHGTMKEVMLSLSPFHLMTVLRQAYRANNPDVAVKAIGQGLWNGYSKNYDNFIAQNKDLFWRARQAGVTMLDQTVAPDVGTRFTGKIGGAIRGFFSGGASAVTGFTEAKQQGASDEDAFHAGLVAGGLGAVGGATLSKPIADMIFQRTIPTLKMMTFAAKTAEGIPDAAAAKFVNNVFGGQNLGNLGSSPVVGQALRLTLLAPDWWLSWAKMIGNTPRPGALGDMTRGYWLRTAIEGAVGLEGLNYAFNGHFTNDNGPGRQFDLETTGLTHATDVRTGQPERTYADFFGPIKAILQLGAAPVEGAMTGEGVGNATFGAAGTFMKSRESLFASLGNAIIANQDYRGQPIVKEGTRPMEAAGNYLQYVLDNVAPVSMSSIMQTNARQGLGATAASAGLGIRQLTGYARESDQLLQQGLSPETKQTLQKSGVVVQGVPTTLSRPGVLDKRFWMTQEERDGLAQDTAQRIDTKLAKLTSGSVFQRKPPEVQRREIQAVVAAQRAVARDQVIRTLGRDEIKKRELLAPPPGLP